MQKKVFKWILLIIWCFVIFNFSSENGEKSEALSKQVINNFVMTINKDTSEETKALIINNSNYIVRKLAHFTEYFILAIFLYTLLIEYPSLKRYNYYLILLFAFVYASSDEIHQIFTQGRSARFQDVLIDTSGALLFIIIMLLINRKKEVSLNGRN